MPAIDDHVETLARDGFCIIEGAFSSEWCDRASAALDRIEREQDRRPSGQDFSGRNTIRIMNLLQYDDFFQELPVSDSFLPVIERYLDKECILSGIDSSKIFPGEKQQAIHTDTWWHDDHRFDFPCCVNTVLALVDFTPDNGSTRIVPGSHLWPAEKVAYETVDSIFAAVPGDHVKGYGTEWTPSVLEMPKGSIALWDSRVLHGAGPNESDAPRPSIISPYILGWMRQLDNFAYAIPQERLRGFSPRLQQLVGLDCFRQHYSQVNNMSPREWLWGEGGEQFRAGKVRSLGA